MINLAGVKDANKFILEELYLAGICAIKIDTVEGEVPFSFVGKIGNWTLKRRRYYWSATVEDKKNGLPLKEAMELHNKKHPIDDSKLGNIIRSGGHCGCPSPDEYGAQPVYNEELDEQLKKLGYKEEYSELMKKNYISINVGEVSELCNEGKLTVERYVSCYHIDDQIGLNEFAKFIIIAINKPVNQ